MRELQDQALGSGARRFVGWLLRQHAVPQARRRRDHAAPAKRVVAARLKLSAEHLSRVLRALANEG